jgi:hypothetical protein
MFFKNPASAGFFISYGKTGVVYQISADILLKCSFVEKS